MCFFQPSQTNDPHDYLELQLLDNQWLTKRYVGCEEIRADTLITNKRNSRYTGVPTT